MVREVKLNRYYLTKDKKILKVRRAEVNPVRHMGLIGSTEKEFAKWITAAIPYKQAQEMYKDRCIALDYKVYGDYVKTYEIFKPRYDPHEPKLYFIFSELYDDRDLDEILIRFNHWINGLYYKVDFFNYDLTTNEPTHTVYGDLRDLTPYLACDITQEVELIQFYDDTRATNLIKELIYLKCEKESR